MNSEWQAFLETQGATVGNDGEVLFSETEDFPECALFDLSHLGLIEIKGDDAETFLQGQTTNDVTKLTTQQSQLSSLCTPKGRMLANFRLLMRDDAYLLQLPVSVHGAIIKRLSMYILMSKVVITDAGDRLVRIGVAGDCAPALLEKHFSTLPTNSGEVLQEKNCTLIKHPGSTSRFEIIGEAECIIDLWSALATAAVPGSPDLWPLYDLRAGIPTIFQETSEAFIPQMANMDLIDGVSFTKGCYTGQEIVARMKYLGKLKRRMYLAHIDDDQRPLPGDDLFSSSSTSGKGAGKVVDARPSPYGGYELLAEMEISGYEGNDMHLGSEEGPKLEFRELPYVFDEE
ncbi:MAG: folate-binding protein YgfZ [Candidatus Sedimenticola sp. (ex Thyasira tokunagai)]